VYVNFVIEFWMLAVAALAGYGLMGSFVAAMLTRYDRDNHDMWLLFFAGWPLVLAFLPFFIAYKLMCGR
jgi:hypothetical protein